MTTDPEYRTSNDEGLISPRSSQGGEKSPDASVSLPRASQSESTFSSDWEAESLLLFAERTCQLLGEGNPNQTETQRTLSTLVRRFMGVVTAYYERGIDLLDSRPGLFGGGLLITDDKPFERRRFIERIGEEWAFLMSLVSSSQLLPATDQVLVVLNRIIAAATTNIKQLDRHKIAVLPHFGRHFELVKFRYAPDVVLLGIPVSSLYCPWEWPVIWHEAAGLYIESIHAAAHSPVTVLQDTLTRAVSDDSIWDVWKVTYKAVLDSFATAAANDHNLADLLDHQGRPADRILRNWSEELLEDAVSVLCLGESMAQTLDAILSQHYSHADGGPSLSELDLRHPPSRLRVEVAGALSFRMGARSSDVADRGVQRLAQAIFDARDQIVHRVYTRADADQIPAVIAEIGRKDTTAVLDNQSPEQIATLVAAMSQAVRAEKVPGDRVREYIYHHSALFPSGVNVQVDDQLTRDLSLQDLDEFTFSERDAFVGVSDHPDHTAAVTVSLSFSGIPVHRRNHHGTISWTHPH